MKQALCSYEGCSNRRAHWATPDVMRNHRKVEVADTFNENEDLAYCSFECALLDGSFSLKKGVLRRKKSDPRPKKEPK